MSDKKYMLLQGDAKNMLATLPSDLVHTVITSPPYWSLRDYFADGQMGHEASPEEYTEHLVDMCKEVKRVLRKDGTFWLNIGDSYNNESGFCRATKGWGRKGRDNGSSDKKALKHPYIKKKELFGVPWMVAFALQKDGWYLRCDVVWCLSGGTEVYVKSNGVDFPISVKDLYRMDPKGVKLWNGSKWTQMMGISRNRQSHNEMQITLRSGERICCTPNHQWPTNRGLLETKNMKVGDILTGCSLPEPDDIFNSDYIPDSDIGWFVGMYLAEGSRSGNTIQISSHKKEIKRYERLKIIAEKYQGFCHKHNISDNGMTINVESDILNAVINMYIGGKVAKNKHLKYRCWRRSNEFLKNILHGYLEGDGHYDKLNDRYRIGFTRNYYLEKSLRALCSRLNISCRIKLAHSKIKDKIYKTFRGEIRFSKKNHFNNKSDYEIIDICRDKGGREYFYDIGVEDDPHLFSLASGVLTHNSKSNPMPDGAKDRPTHGHEYIFLLSKSPTYFYDYYNSLEATAYTPQQVQRFGARNQKGTFRQDQDRTFEAYGMRNKRSVWTTSVSSFSGEHFATYPLALIETCIKVSTSDHGCCKECGKPWGRKTEKVEIPSEDGKESEKKLIALPWEKRCKCSTDERKPCLILDPFSGMATTGIGSLRHKRYYLGIELSQHYIDLSRDRIKSEMGNDIYMSEVNSLGDMDYVY
jgi:DNA modification methylase